MVAGRVASAQTMTAQISFEFRAGNQVMAPGTYQVDNPEHADWHFRSTVLDRELTPGNNGVGGRLG